MNLKDSCSSIVSNRYFEWTITAVIVVNAILIGIELNVCNSIIALTQKIILLIFTIEILMRFMARDSVKDFFQTAGTFSICRSFSSATFLKRCLPMPPP